MTAPVALNQFSVIQNLLVALVESSDDNAYRQQYHFELHPLGWYLGRCVYVETYWLWEKIHGDCSRSAPYRALYAAEAKPGPQCGHVLPPRNTLLDWAVHLQSDNLMLLANLQPDQTRHVLSNDEDLVLFLTQHHALCYETMLMVLTQRALHKAYPDHRVRSPLFAASETGEKRSVPAGHYRIGGTAPTAFDNELPAQHAELGTFQIATQPVSNGAYLAFMENDGYADARLWSEPAWAWRLQNLARGPDHWRRDIDGAWYGVGMNGPYDLAADAPVQGVNYYEACAYALWAGARLPHEFQWEAAYRSRLLEDAGRVWEWCANSFYPYQGFKAFPDAEVSKNAFDGAHYSLRGASIHTRPELRRASLRNFHKAERRHIFAGLRLTY